jgi:hypothetical protein
MSCQTQISYILNVEKDGEEKDEEILNFDENNLQKIIMDFSIENDIRIKALDLFFKTNVETDNCLEIINKICTIYEMSGTRNLRNYIFDICKKSNIDLFLKIICAKSLNSYDEKDPLAYEAIDIIYSKINDSQISTIYKIDILKILMKNDDYKENSKKYFCEIIQDEKINSVFRLKNIYSLENSEKDYSYFIREALLCFFNNEKNEINLRIISCQSLLKKYEQYQIQPILYAICENVEYSENVRADACDTLLYGGTDEYKQKARIIINTLGNVKNIDKTIYGNSQNVHVEEIEKSIIQGIEFLNKFELMKVNNQNIDFDYVKNQIISVVTEQNIDRINLALNRILIDKTIYTYNCTLLNILLRVWTYISSHESEDEIKKRLIEELEDMADTCSSGFISRLINVISGFGEFNLQISWRDQIIANFSARLNTKIRDIDDLNLRDKILSEMILPVDNYTERKRFLKFLRNNLLIIRSELYNEFKNYISDTDFDLYFRTAVSQYEISTYI